MNLIRKNHRQSRVKINKTIYMTIVMISLQWMGCYYDNAEDLYPSGCQTENISYTGFVRPFLVAGCSCHVNGNRDGSVNLEGHSNVRTFVDNQLLLRVIKHESGVIPMPLGQPKRSDCDISKVEAWIRAGALNN
jgi:hypothetical protein